MEDNEQHTVIKIGLDSKFVDRVNAQLDSLENLMLLQVRINDEIFDKLSQIEKKVNNGPIDNKGLEQGMDEWGKVINTSKH